MPDFALISLVNDRAQFAEAQQSLRAAVEPLPPWLMVEPNPRGWNAAQGLNHGLDQLDAEWLICVHQDVLFPADFWRRLTAGLRALPPDTALAGVVGCEANGRFRGHIVDPNGHCCWPPVPHRVLALDEVLIAVRRSSGLRFDESVPGFHCYGAALCFEAAQRGFGCAVVDAPLVHLSTGRLDAAYQRASRWLLDRYGPRHGHVLATPALLLRGDRAGFLHSTLHRWRRRQDRLSRNDNPCGDSNCAARALGETAFAGKGR